MSEEMPLEIGIVEKRFFANITLVLQTSVSRSVNVQMRPVPECFAAQITGKLLLARVDH